MKEENKPIEVNQPWERIPQHANDPGYGPIPPESNVIELFQRPEIQKTRHWLLDALYWLVWCLALAALVIALGGCAPAVRVDESGVTWNDYAKCKPYGATSCYIGGKLYCDAFDLIACDHERDHARGMTHAMPWIWIRGEQCAEIRRVGNTNWHAGYLMCRNRNGFYERAI